jgi:hypothetical protein
MTRLCLVKHQTAGQISKRKLAKNQIYGHGKLDPLQPASSAQLEPSAVKSASEPKSHVETHGATSPIDVFGARYPCSRFAKT